MREQDLLPRLKELYLPPSSHFVLVRVPAMRFLMLDGYGADDRAPLDHAVKWLFTAIRPIKAFARQRMGKRFVQPPLEALWWADDPRDLIHANRARLHWRMMIVFEPAWLTRPMFEDAVAAAAKRLGQPPPGLRLERFAEGRCAQIMHLGPPANQVPTVTRLHTEFLPQHNLAPNGHHHEIYLNDPKRVAPEKLKTVLRQPVR